MSPHPDDDRAATMQTLEISVVSIEGLNNYSSYFSRIRPFIALTKLPTQVVYDGGGGGTRDHVFRVPVDPTFFSDTYSCLHLQLYNNRRIVGPTKLGWCMIPPSDIASLLPNDSVRYLSYRLRATDGSRGHVIINLSIRLQRGGSCSSLPWITPPYTCQTVIGIPVTAVRGIGNGHSSSTTKHLAP